MAWAANYATAIELTRDFINLVLDKLLLVLKTQGRHQYKKNLGFFGTFEAELTDVAVPDLEDPAPVGGGVVTDLDVRGKFVFRLFGLFRFRSEILFSVRDVLLDFVATNAGLPNGISIVVTPSLQVSVTFPMASFLIRWLLNGVFGRLISFGVWLAFRVIRRVEIPVWELVDIFAVLGLRFAPGSPLLTAQKTVIPHSLLVASGFNLTQPLVGNPNQLASFLPVGTNIGAVVHERVVAAGVQLAFAKGWVPSNFKVGGWKISINDISVTFVQDKIMVRAGAKAKRGSCWCRVRARLRIRAEVEPEIVNAPAQPVAVFRYAANVNAHVSTSGMLVVLGVLMLAPLFMAFTIGLSVLVNIVLSKFLPFSTQFSVAGGNLQVQLNSVNFSGFVPFSMNFPLKLSGQGTFDLTPFKQFQLPGNVPVQVNFTNESIAVQPAELRAAVGLS